MTPVVVRRAIPAEAAAVSRLLAEAIKDSYTHLLGEATVLRLVGEQCSLPRIKAEIGIPGGAPGWLGWLVAVTSDDTVVGAVAGGVPVTEVGELYSLCTSPARRREQIGSRLLAAATDRQRVHGGRRQAVSLLTRGDPALPFLVHHGFRPEGTGEEPAVQRYVRAI